MPTFEMTTDEQKIYDSIMSRFPSTAPESAYNVAIQGGIKFEYVSK